MEKRKKMMEVKFYVNPEHYKYAGQLIEEQDWLGFETVEDLAKVALREYVEKIGRNSIIHSRPGRPE